MLSSSLALDLFLRVDDRGAVMAKKVYVIEWWNESGDEGVIGYWDKPLTEEEQHGLFYEQTSDYESYEDIRYVNWRQEEMDLQERPPAIPKEKWLDGC
jgi:hypothetical protein